MRTQTRIAAHTAANTLTQVYEYFYLFYLLIKHPSRTDSNIIICIQRKDAYKEKKQQSLMNIYAYIKPKNKLSPSPNSIQSQKDNFIKLVP